MEKSKGLCLTMYFISLFLNIKPLKPEYILIDLLVLSLRRLNNVLWGDQALKSAGNLNAHTLMMGEGNGNPLQYS